MPVAEVNGQSITYSDSGGDGKALLFSHGFLMDHTMFDEQVASLSETYRCIAWDERGFGDTPATEPFTYWDSAADAVALLDHLDIDEAVFIGMSQGGFLSLRAALANPERVRALVLIDSRAGQDDAETLAGYQGMIDHWLSDAPLGEVGQFVAGLILGEPTLNETWIAKWEARDRSTMALPAQTLLTRDDISDRMGEIQCPVLSIHGEADQSIDISHAEELQAAVPHSRGLVRVPGAAHAPNMTHPEIVNPALGAFLNQLDS
ncbi:MAG: alpha/beta hydrolase [Actinobacteria bacterium]|nr:alpha/beta hydrolase [Actinomycetota bacterium]